MSEIRNSNSNSGTNNQDKSPNSLQSSIHKVTKEFSNEDKQKLLDIGRALLEEENMHYMPDEIDPNVNQKKSLSQKKIQKREHS